MKNSDITTAFTHWLERADTIFVPHSDAEYSRLVVLLDRLIDEVGEDDAHPLASLMEVLAVLIEGYEDEHVPELNSEETTYDD